MRIIGGEARGRVLKTHKQEDLSIRPMLGRMKKSLFDILAPRLSGADFLDLYAGTGAVGLEALSRGAARAVFVELSMRSIELIRQNLAMLKWEDRAEILNIDATRLTGCVDGSFNIIFMGPPYKDDRKRMLALTAPTLVSVVEAGILKPGGIIISQRHETEPVEVPAALAEYRREKYGDTVVAFYKARE